jgi:hypothetical protein
MPVPLFLLFLPSLPGISLNGLPPLVPLLILSIEILLKRLSTPAAAAVPVCPPFGDVVNLEVTFLVNVFFMVLSSVAKVLLAPCCCYVVWFLDYKKALLALLHPTRASYLFE